MTAEQLARLRSLLREDSSSKARVEGERELQSDIALRAKRECGVEKPDFAKLAKAYYKDNMTGARDECIAQADLFDAMIGEDDGKSGIQ